MHASPFKVCTMHLGWRLSYRLVPHINFSVVRVPLLVCDMRAQARLNFKNFEKFYLFCTKSVFDSLYLPCVDIEEIYNFCIDTVD